MLHLPPIGADRLVICYVLVGAYPEPSLLHLPLVDSERVRIPSSWRPSLQATYLAGRAGALQDGACSAIRTAVPKKVCALQPPIRVIAPHYMATYGTLGILGTPPWLSATLPSAPPRPLWVALPDAEGR